MTNAAGTRQQIDGLAVGAATRAEADQTGRPVAYVVALQEGWYWAGLPGSAVHLVPPYGDAAHCGRHLIRADRHPVTHGIAERACGSCWKSVLGDTPRRTQP